MMRLLTAAITLSLIHIFAGKCRYMAPEVVRHEAKPSIHTDRFSLAVVLYKMLFVEHPLEGKRRCV